MSLKKVVFRNTMERLPVGEGIRRDPPISQINCSWRFKRKKCAVQQAPLFSSLRCFGRAMKSNSDRCSTSKRRGTGRMLEASLHVIGMWCAPLPSQLLSSHLSCTPGKGGLGRTSGTASFPLPSLLPGVPTLPLPVVALWASSSSPCAGKTTATVVSRGSPHPHMAQGPLWLEQ